MTKIAIFGKPASGKSTLGVKLAKSTGLALYAVDSLLYAPNGEEVNGVDFEKIHDNLLTSDDWIIEGFGPLKSLAPFKKRLQAADVLVYIDLPYFVTYWLVTKRFLKGLFVKPEGWPPESSLLRGTWQSYKTLIRCPKFWNEKFLTELEKLAADKPLYVIRSVSELGTFEKHYTQST